MLDAVPFVTLEAVGLHCALITQNIDVVLNAEALLDRNLPLQLHKKCSEATNTFAAAPPKWHTFLLNLFLHMYKY